MRQQGEASVEEILASIKQVIARDNRAGAMEERRRRESAGLKNLAEELGQDEPAKQASPSAPDFTDDEGVLDLSEADFVEQDEDFADFGDNGADSDGDPPLTADPLRDSIRENFAALAMLSKPGVQPQIVRSGETSLEGLVRELLRPMLTEWIDKNLPGMVEKMVQAEIARIAGKRG
jgi:cell pole-organizing protein PopZ